MTRRSKLLIEYKKDVEVEVQEGVVEEAAIVLREVVGDVIDVLKEVVEDELVDDLLKVVEGGVEQVKVEYKK